MHMFWHTFDAARHKTHKTCSPTSDNARTLPRRHAVDSRQIKLIPARFFDTSAQTVLDFGLKPAKQCDWKRNRECMYVPLYIHNDGFVVGIWWSETSIRSVQPSASVPGHRCAAQSLRQAASAHARCTNLASPADDKSCGQNSVPSA